jgi:hypothetical protein
VPLSFPILASELTNELELDLRNAFENGSLRVKTLFGCVSRCEDIAQGLIANFVAIIDKFLACG